MFGAEAVAHRVEGLSGLIGALSRRITTPAAVALIIEAEQEAAVQSGAGMPQGHRKVAVAAGES